MDVEWMISIITVIVGIVIFMSVTKPTIKVYNRVLRGERFAKLLYTDEQGGKLLHAEKYALQGKPDYIFEKWMNRKLIPFEIKSGQCKEMWPHEGDLMQLVAYFLIIEESYGKKPPYGCLVYNNRSFRIRNTRSLRKQLKKTLNEMQNMLEKKGRCPHEAHPSYIKCKNCICQKTVCQWYEKKEKV